MLDNMITDMESNKNLSPIVTELFLRGRKLSTSLIYLAILFQSAYTIRLNATHDFIMKIPNKREL